MTQHLFSGMDQDTLRQTAQGLLVARGNARAIESLMDSLLPLIDRSQKTRPTPRETLLSIRDAALSCGGQLADLYEQVAREAFIEEDQDA